MAKILGLDLGTNSIGWAVVEKERDSEFQLLEKGVRIFQEGVELYLIKTTNLSKTEALIFSFGI
ncbi:MAG: hypothetical protein R2757_16120 [Draconibacterium sp.]